MYGGRNCDYFHWKWVCIIVQGSRIKLKKIGRKCAWRIFDFIKTNDFIRTMSKLKILICSLLFVTSLFYGQTKNVSNVTQFLNELDAIAAGTSATTEIVLEENTYTITSEIELTSAHNGVTISGCGNVYLNGGVVLKAADFVEYASISSGFSLATPSVASNIKVYDLTNLGISKSDLGSHEHHGYGFSDNLFYVS